MRSTRTLHALSAASAWLAVAGLAFAQAPAEKPKPADDLDRQLLENLGAGSDDAELLGELGLATIPEEQAPLLAIGQKMQDAAALLARTDAGPQTQQLQADVVASLDKIIEAVRRQCRRQPGRSSPQPGKTRSNGNSESSAGNMGEGTPNRTRNDDGSPKKTPVGGRIDPRQLERLAPAAWGNLPDKVRQELQNALTSENFLPKYEPMIEQYFKRLAEEDERP